MAAAQQPSEHVAADRDAAVQCRPPLLDAPLRQLERLGGQVFPWSELGYLQQVLQHARDDSLCLKVVVNAQLMAVDGPR